MKTYKYKELIKMKKKKVIQLAGFKNMKQLLLAGFNRERAGFNPMTHRPTYIYVNASKKYIANIIASDR